MNPRCNHCGTTVDVIPAEIPSGPPEHVWRFWCRPCLAENRRRYREERGVWRRPGDAGGKQPAANERPCTKDDPRIPWLCSCDECARTAAGAWHGLMDRVFGGTLSLDEAQRLADG